MIAAALPGTRNTRAAYPPGKPTGQVIIGLSQEPTVFHPLKLHIEVDEGVYFNLFSALWRVAIPRAISCRTSPPRSRPLANGGVSEDGLPGASSCATMSNGMTARPSRPRT